MTDDIVTRLRRVPERVPKGMGIVGLNEYYQRCQDAADEIERLREEVNLWMGVAERFAESHPHYEAFRYYFRARTK
jgi:hypothetical protein